MRSLLATLVAVVLFQAVGGSIAADLGPAMARASGPFYGALVASARGNTDATNRQLLLLAARWDAAAREARTDGPPELIRDPAWDAALDRATALLSKARELARARDIAGAHANLEEMRLVLHEVREKHGVWTFDDHLAEYHEATERVTGHVSGPSEINLTARDYQDIDEDLAAARTSWAGVQRAAGSMNDGAAWRAAARDTASALDGAGKALAAKDRTAVARAVERLKNSYYELLSAIARARG